MRRFISDTLLSLAAAIWKQERPPAAAAHPLHSQKTARTAPACACRHTLHHHAHALPISPPLGTQVTSHSLLPRPRSCTGATVRLARVSTTIGANGG